MVNCESGKKAVEGGRGRKEARSKKNDKAKAVCGAESISPRSCPCWNNTKLFLDHGRVFPALTST